MRGSVRACAVLALPVRGAHGSAGWPTRGAMADGSGEVVAVLASGVTTGLGNGAGGTSAQPSNPLSRKLHKILETRLDNDKVTGAGGRPETRVAYGAAPGRGRCCRHPVLPPSSPPGRAPRPAQGA